MIRIGIDVVDIARLSRILDQWPRLAERLFTQTERHYAARRARPAEHLAARLAAKEAAFKALGVGWPAVAWHDVQVVSTGGRPELVLNGKAAELAGEARRCVSLTHDAGIALAEVLLVG